MIELKYEVVRNQAFQQALAKLLHYPRFSFGTAKAIAKVVQTVRGAGDAAQERFAVVVKAHAFLDEKGEILPNEGVAGTYKIMPDKYADFQKAIEAMESETFSVDVAPFEMQQLDGVELSASDLLLLAPLLTEETAVGAKPSPQLGLVEAPAH